jgi:hypothetical protein
MRMGLKLLLSLSLSIFFVSGCVNPLASYNQKFLGVWQDCKRIEMTKQLPPYALDIECWPIAKREFPEYAIELDALIAKATILRDNPNAYNFTVEEEKYKKMVTDFLAFTRAQAENDETKFNTFLRLMELGNASRVSNPGIPNIPNIPNAPELPKSPSCIYTNGQRTCY